MKVAITPQTSCDPGEIGKKKNHGSHAQFPVGSGPQSTMGRAATNDGRRKQSWSHRKVCEQGGKATPTGTSDEEVAAGEDSRRKLCELGSQSRSVVRGEKAKLAIHPQRGTFYFSRLILASGARRGWRRRR